MVFDGFVFGAADTDEEDSNLAFICFIVFVRGCTTFNM